MPLRPDLRAALAGSNAVLAARGRSVSLADLSSGNPLSVPIAELDGAKVLIRVQSQLHAALALVALDGVAARMVIAPPDLKQDHLADVIARAGIDTFAGDGEMVNGSRQVAVSTRFAPLNGQLRGRDTEWVMFTSGTTGAPKMVAHSLSALTGAIAPRANADPVVWGTFYDIRRYGGLQVFLRALTGGASLILSEAGEAVADFLTRLGKAGVTHLTGTPSHWRSALMSPAIAGIAPRYVRLSGEIAGQAVLDSLKAQFPAAAIAHAYASTEAGVGFEVTDGLEGFPAEFVGRSGPVEMRMVDGSLQLRSSRTAQDYVGGGILKQDGWVDSGDLVELRGDRYHFIGRRGGIINVGGLKINPEEVEAVINRHPGVALSRVSGRKNPITGALVVAEVVLADAASDNTNFKESLLARCRQELPSFKVPAMVRFVKALEITAGGKLARHA
jgi:acyl-coenzyme A synthetase/AMP-(fatty) acid ligase